jgi:hypothetical protein
MLGRCRTTSSESADKYTCISSPAAAIAGSRDSIVLDRNPHFEEICEDVRQQLKFDVYGYVVMPEHFHILISEPKKERSINGVADLEATRRKETECCRK